MKVLVAADQLFRPSPGGIASYVRGLLQGLAQLGGSIEVRALVPRAAPDTIEGVPSAHAPVGLRALTGAWAVAALGVPRDADVVHAPTLAGPYGGGRVGAVHSVALHDVFWRERPEGFTARGVRFHEARLRRVVRDTTLRVFTTSPGLGTRLKDLGIADERIHPVRLGVDDATEALGQVEVAALLARAGVSGPYCLYVGTREPRKNLERLVAAHELARSRDAGLGPLVMVGPAGWGAVSTGSAVVLGPQSRGAIKGLLRDATVCAYVALAEGFGLPPLEALYAGTRVVVSREVPSVAGNAEVVPVDPLDVESIARGLLDALDQGDGDEDRTRRRDSVSQYSWANCARDHVAGWQ